MIDLVDLKICGLTIPEAKEILVKVREVEQRCQDRTFFVQLLGLEHKSLKEAEQFLKDIFPKKEGIDFFTAILKNKDKNQSVKK